MALTEKYPKSRFAYSALFDAARYAVKVGLDASYKDALAILDRLCAAHPDDPRNFYARLEQADVLKLLNSFADARALYNEILNKYPSHPEVRLAWLGLGDATLAQNARTLEAAAILKGFIRCLICRPRRVRRPRLNGVSPSRGRGKPARPTRSGG